MEKESFRKAIISLGIARIIGIGLSFGVSIFVSRALGPEGRGALASYGTAQAFLILLLTLGLGNAVNYTVAANPDRKEHYYWTALVCSIVTYLVGMVVLAILLMSTGIFTEGWYLFVLIAIWVLAGLLLDITVGYTSGLHLFSKISTADVVSNCALFCMITAGYLLNRITVSFIVIVTIVSLTIRFAYIAHGVLSFSRTAFEMDLRNARRMLDIGFRNISINLLGQVFSRADVFIVLAFATKAELGLYVNAQIPFNLIMMFPGLIGQVIATRTASNDKDTLPRIIKMANYSTAIALISCLIIVFCGPGMFALLFGKSFMKSYDIFLYIIPGLLFMVFGSGYGNALAGKGYPSGYLVASIVAVIVNIAMNLILIPSKGAIGAAIASSATYAVLVVMLLYIFKKIYQITLLQTIGVSPLVIDVNRTMP